MKTYLTKNGLLVVREDASFFTSNSGEFRRIATADEVDYLISFLEEVSIKADPIMRKEGRKQFPAKLENMVVPLWHHLWSISNDDYSRYKPGTCSNGGDYSYHESKHFFARKINGEWEIRALTTHSTSAEFSYDELSGSFQSNLDRVELAGISGDKEWIFATQNGGKDEEISIDQLLDEGSWALEAALTATGHYIPERDRGEEGHDQELTVAETARRKEICNAIGLHENTRRGCNGRNQRR